MTRTQQATRECNRAGQHPCVLASHRCPTRGRALRGIGEPLLYALWASEFPTPSAMLRTLRTDHVDVDALSHRVAAMAARCSEQYQSMSCALGRARVDWLLDGLTLVTTTLRAAVGDADAQFNLSRAEDAAHWRRFSRAAAE